MSKPTDTPRDLIPPREACEIARCSVWTLQRLARSGRIRRFARPGLKIACSWYSRAEVERIAPRPV